MVADSWISKEVSGLRLEDAAAVKRNDGFMVCWPACLFVALPSLFVYYARLSIDHPMG